MKTYQNNHKNYSIRKISRSFARIAIESSPSLDPRRKPEIWRYYLDGAGIPQMHKGAIIGKEAGENCALIILVSRGDLICVREKVVAVENHQWRYYRIGERYELTPKNLPNRCMSKKEIALLIENSDLREDHEMEVTDDDLRRVFSQKHPDWLQRITQRQLAHWQKHKLAKFFLFAPLVGEEIDIDQCAKIAPFAALARYQERLSRKQFAQCISRSQIGAVMYAVDKIPSSKRRTYLLNHPREALLYSARKLSNSDLRFCASIDMVTAFRIRDKMEPERRALLLAHSYLLAGIEKSGNSLTALQDEIRVSIAQHPEQWRASDPEGFPSIFEGLAEYVGMWIDHATLRVLLENTGVNDQHVIAQFITHGI